MNYIVSKEVFDALLQNLQKQPLGEVLNVFIALRNSPVQKAEGPDGTVEKKPTAPAAVATTVPPEKK